MESKAYEYMDWPRIEAIVYGEEASPKDVMAPRLTTDGVLVQGFFPEADKAEVLVGSRKYEMEKGWHGLRNRRDLKGRDRMDVYRKSLYRSPWSFQS